MINFFLLFIGVIPAVHLTLVEGLHWMFENASFHWLLLMGALYLMGASIYATRFPERCFPGKFDIFVSFFLKGSHTCFIVKYKTVADLKVISLY